MYTNVYNDDGSCTVQIIPNDLHSSSTLIGSDIKRKFEMDNISKPTQSMSQMMTKIPNITMRPLDENKNKKPACKSPYREIDSRIKSKESRKAKNKQKLAMRLKEKRRKRRNK